MATNRRGRTSEAGPLRRSAPSVGRFSREIRPQEPVPRFGESAPPPLHRLRRLMETGIGGRLLRETCSPSRLPSFPVAFCSSSAFLPMSCLEIWVEAPGFSNPPLPASTPFASIAALWSLRSLHWTSPFFPHLCGGHHRFPQFDNRGRTGSPSPPSAGGAGGNGNWGREPGETHSPSPLPLFAMVVCSSSAFLSMSYLEIWVAGPEFLKPALPAPRPFVSIGALSSLRLLDRVKGSTHPRFPPSPTLFWWGALVLSLIRESGEAGALRLPIGARADGVLIPGTLTRRDRLSEVLRCPPCDQLLWHRRSCRCCQVRRRD